MNSAAQALPYTPYAHLLAARGFPGVKVRKITLNGGFTCPNLDGTKAFGGCTFCDNRGFSPSAENRDMPLRTQLEQGMAYARARFKAEKFIAYFQNNSGTYAPVFRLRELYRQALDSPDVIGLSIGTRPDCVGPDVVDLLEELGKKTFLTLELGLQSASDASLRRINRASTFDDFARAMDLCQGRNFDLCVHVILGLPGESQDQFRQTAGSLGNWNYHAIKIHPLHVVRGTVLAAQYARGEYIPLEMEKYITALVDFLERVPDTVGVQRFTGDARGDLLIAPLWCRKKSQVLESMKSEFIRRGSFQGFHFEQHASV